MDFAKIQYCLENNLNLIPLGKTVAEVFVNIFDAIVIKFDDGDMIVLDTLGGIELKASE